MSQVALPHSTTFMSGVARGGSLISIGVPFCYGFKPIGNLLLLANILSLLAVELTLIAFPAFAAFVPVCVAWGIFMPIGAMRFLLVPISCAVGVSELRHNFKMRRIDTIFVLANVMQELIRC